MDSRIETINGTTAAATGLGVVAFALFPLAVPIVVLTIVFTLPLLVPLLVPAVLGGILLGAGLTLRAVGRGVRRLRSRRPRIGRPAAMAPTEDPR